MSLGVTPPTTARGATPRQARAFATRETIVEAAAAEFAQLGYHQASLAGVVTRSGLTKGALYFHFESKLEMATTVVGRMAEAYRELAGSTAGRGPDPLREAALLARDVQELLDHRVDVAAGQRLSGEGVAGTEWAAWPTEFWQDVFAGLFAQGLAQGIVRPGVDPLASARFVVDISAGAFRNSLITTGLADLAERVRHNWELMFASLAEPAWRERWQAEGGMATVLAAHLPSHAPAHLSSSSPRRDEVEGLV